MAEQGYIQSEVPAETLNYYMEYFSRWLGAPSNLLQAIATKESSYDPNTGAFYNVCNNMGACGLMQLRPIALRDIKQRFGMNIDPLDPIQAIVGAALMFYLNRQYLRYYTRKNPPLSALIVAYNGGWQAGFTYMMRGYPPTVEGRNYLAFVGSRVGVA